eukprot:scaffold55923_cov25-Tisochrysis_lutea.AAC.2
MAIEFRCLIGRYRLAVTVRDESGKGEACRSEALNASLEVVMVLETILVVLQGTHDHGVLFAVTVPLENDARILTQVKGRLVCHLGSHVIDDCGHAFGRIVLDIIGRLKVWCWCISKTASDCRRAEILVKDVAHEDAIAVGIGALPVRDRLPDCKASARKA